MQQQDIIGAGLRMKAQSTPMKAFKKSSMAKSMPKKRGVKRASYKMLDMHK